MTKCWAFYFITIFYNFFNYYEICYFLNKYNKHKNTVIQCGQITLYVLTQHKLLTLANNKNKMIHCYTTELFFLIKVLIRFMFLPFVHVEEKKRKDESCKKSTKKTGLMLSAKQFCWKVLITYSRVQCMYTYIIYTYIIIHCAFMHDVSLYILFANAFSSDAYLYVDKCTRERILHVFLVDLYGTCVCVTELCNMQFLRFVN